MRDFESFLVSRAQPVLLGMGGTGGPGGVYCHAALGTPAPHLTMTDLIDISMPLRPGMLNYPGNPPFDWQQHRSLAAGDSSNNSHFSMGCHVGTHVDAPAHYEPGGPTMQSLDPGLLIGTCRVFHLAALQISAQTLAGLDLAGVRRALFRTPSSEDLHQTDFRTEFAHVTSDGADTLLQAGVRLVGVDYLSVDRYKAPGHPAHHKLLGAGVVVVEGLRLSAVQAGDYELICCPLPIPDSEAAPARVFLRPLRPAR